MKVCFNELDCNFIYFWIIAFVTRHPFIVRFLLLDFTRLKLVKKLNEAMEKQQKKAKALELEAEKQMKGLSLKDKDITAAFDANDDEDVVF